MKYAAVLGLVGLVMAEGEQLVKRQDKVPVPPQTYQLLSDYASYPGLTNILASRPCTTSTNGARLLKYIDNDDTDTQAAIWALDARRELILALPGTASRQDWRTDFQLALVAYTSPRTACPDSSCRAHLGFLTAWNSIAPAVEDALAQALAQHPGYSTVISGHSLGGALASLAFGTLRNGPYNVSRVFTLGQPRVGNQAFADYIDRLAGATDTEPGVIFRITHADDGVPKVPLPRYGYAHTRTEYWESAADAAENSTFRCFDQEPEDCNQSTSFVFGRAHLTYAGFGMDCQ